MNTNMLATAGVTVQPLFIFEKNTTKTKDVMLGLSDFKTSVQCMQTPRPLNLNGQGLSPRSPCEK